VLLFFSIRWLDCSLLPGFQSEAHNARDINPNPLKRVIDYLWQMMFFVLTPNPLKRVIAYILAKMYFNSLLILMLTFVSLNG
jgi:hypothetical protein